MKVWYNRVNESRRSMVEVGDTEVTIGRDPANSVCLQSPLVSRRHAVVRPAGGKLHLENVGLNSCIVGDEEVLGGQSAVFEPGAKVRIWPYTLSFEAERAAAVSRTELETHLRSIVAELELRIHRKLLERLDLCEFEAQRGSDAASILLLENNIDDVCRDLGLFAAENEALLEEITGLVLRDHLVNQLILETGTQEYFDLASLTSNEFDVPATLVPEREAELHGLLQFVHQRLDLPECRDVTERVHRVETRFHDVFHLVRPHLHGELRKYLILRTLKKDLKDMIFGFGPLQDLLRAPTVTEIMVVASDLIYVERGGVIEKSGRRFISDKVTESIIERIVAQVGRRIDKSQPLVDARLPDGSRVNAIIPPLACKGPTLTIRKFPAQRLTMDDLVEMNCLGAAAATFLRACVIDRRNILISGGTGTGKTTLVEHPQRLYPLQRADHYDRRHHRAAAAPGARRHAGNQAGQRRRGGRIRGTRPGQERPAHAARSDHRGRMPRARGARYDPGHEYRPRRLDDHRSRQQRPRGDRAAGSAGPDGGRPARQLHSPPACLGVGFDRPHQSFAGRGADRHAGDGGRPLRSRRGPDCPARHFQLPRRRFAAGERLSALVRRFAGGEGIARHRVSLWPGLFGGKGIRVTGNRASFMIFHWAAILGIASMGLATAIAGYAGSEYLVLAFDAVERDLADKLRRLRLSRHHLRKYLAGWLVAAGGAFLACWLALGSLVFAVLILACVAAAPWYLLRRLAERRRQKIEDQLADAMVMLAGAVRAGLSLAQAMEILAAQCPQPINAEFRQIVAEYQLGKPLGAALTEAKGRLQSENFALLAAALLASHESGGRLNETVERIAQSVRELQRLERKIMAETAQARTSAVYMALAPALILVVYYFVDPLNTTLLFTKLAGQMLLAVAILFDVLAYLWARVILNPDI